MDYRKREKCSGCGSYDDMIDVLNFGDIPLAGYFPRIEEINNEKSYGCNIVICDNCGLVQVDTLVDPNILFEDYRYTSSTGLSGHFSKTASLLEEKFNLSKNKKVLEIGSNDGVLLRPMMDIGIDCIGFEPSKNISEISKKRGCDVIVDYFNYQSVLKYNLSKKIDLVVANNVFAHIDDINSVIDGIKSCLKDDGIFVAEVHYLLDLVQKNQYDFIYHEHIFYHSLFSLSNLFNRKGMRIFDFERIDVHSGSIRIYVDKFKREVSPELSIQLKNEYKFGITNSKGLKQFSEKVNNHIISCKNEINRLIDEGRTIVGFGASGRCNIFCNLIEIGTSQVKYIFDQSSERVNRFIPKCNIPIIKFDETYSQVEFDVVLIFAWNFSNMIMNKIKAKNYLILFPEPILVEGGDVIPDVL